MPDLTLILHNIRSTYNVGAILRTAEGLGARQAVLSGYTPYWRRPDLLPHQADKLRRQIAKTALGAEQLLPTSWSTDVITTLEQLRNKGCQIIGLDNHLPPEYAGQVTPLPQLQLSSPAALVLGEEVAGIPAELLPHISTFAEIPMRGQKESFNVSVAAGIAMYALLVGQVEEPQILDPDKLTKEEFIAEIDKTDAEIATGEVELAEDFFKRLNKEYEIPAENSDIQYKV